MSFFEFDILTLPALIRSVRPYAIYDVMIKVCNNTSGIMKYYILKLNFFSALFTLFGNQSNCTECGIFCASKDTKNKVNIDLNKTISITTYGAQNVVDTKNES